MREDWTETQIGDVAKLYQPKTISAKMLVADGEHPVYGANGIIGNYDKYNHEEEEFLITCRGATCGNVHITQPYSWINGNAMVVQPFKKELLSLKYLKFVFSNKGRTQKAISGSAQPQITRSTLTSIQIPLAPLPEQLTIVAKIEELFSDLDKGIADLKTAQDQLKVYRQAVLKKAFEGELTKGWREKQININKIWEFVAFKNVFSDKPQNGIYKPGSDYGSGTKILRIDGFYCGVILHDYNFQRVRFEDSEIEKYSLALGDIVINRVNSMSHLGKCGLVKMMDENLVFESNIMKINLNFDLIVSEYITHYLASHKGITELVKNAKQAVNQASINQSDVSNAIIPICSKEEQYQIIKEIESRLSVCDKVEQSITESLEKAEALRQSILKKAFEGKLLSAGEIAKCKAAKDYEPASVLLAKIKAEKKKTSKK